MSRYMITFQDMESFQIEDVTADSGPDAVAIVRSRDENRTVISVVEVLPGIDYDKERYGADADNEDYAMMELK